MYFRLPQLWCFSRHRWPLVQLTQYTASLTPSYLASWFVTRHPLNSLPITIISCSARASLRFLKVCLSSEAFMGARREPLVCGGIVLYYDAMETKYWHHPSTN